MYSILGRVFSNNSLDRIYRKKRRKSLVDSCGYVLTLALRMEPGALGTLGSKGIPAKQKF